MSPLQQIIAHAAFSPKRFRYASMN
jgi:hypothetical protein